MSDETGGDVLKALANAEARVARQEEEIEALRAELADQRIAKDVREALTAAAAAGTLGSPVTHSQLLRMIIETAADVIDAESAVLLLLDEEGDELVFDVTFGVEDEEVRGVRLPIGHGIAGLVAASGQPIAVSDAAGDSRVAREIAESLPYVPQSILCVPLFYNDRLIGVLEVIDKEGGRSFTSRDIETLGAFARQAAVAIRQSRTHQNLAALMGEIMESLGDESLDRPTMRIEATDFAARIEEDSAYRQSRELMELVHEVSQYGEDELSACRSLVESFAEYLRTRTHPRGDIEPVR
ncbi:MAG: GAF domain-containing protein [Actinobacteria bacterium]|nr:GAF domain-containing protein [Actinomycetota bacterium]